MKEYKGSTATVELHDDRIVIRRKGRRQKIFGRPETREIPCAAISEVKVRPATKFNRGCFQLQLEGAAPRTENDDPNSVFFWLQENSSFEELADVLNQRLAENTARGVDPTAAELDPGHSRVDDLQAKQHSTQDELAGQSAGGEQNVAEDRAHEPSARTPAREIDRRSKATDSPRTADSQSPSSDIPDQIRKLAELRDSNIISSEEFEAKKAELLSRM